MSEKRYIEVVGADANNLCDVSASIPINALTAIVGVSGSGKSSLLENTLGYEAANRMRCFLNIDSGVTAEGVRAYIGELPPAISVGQRKFQASSRSTIGTATPLLRLLRKLFVQFGKLYADDIGSYVPEITPELLALWLSQYVRGRAVVWAVPVYQYATTGVDAVRRMSQAGITEFRVFSETDRGKKSETGTPMSTAKFQPLRSKVRHTIEALTGEVIVGKESLTQLTALLTLAWKAADGNVFVELPSCNLIELKRGFSYGLDTRIHRIHPNSPRVFRLPSAHLLSFNSPQHDQSGACQVCAGSGRAATVDIASLVSDPSKSMHEGALALWTPKNYKYVSIQHATIEGLRGRVGFDPNVPWSKLPMRARALILDGSVEPVVDIDPVSGNTASGPHLFHGFKRAILERFSRGTSASEALHRFVSSGICEACRGTRWSLQARAVRVGGLTVDQVLAMSFLELRVLMSDTTWHRHVDAGGARGGRRSTPVALNLAKISEGFTNLGLGHLSGARGMLDVSDGESRRIQLAAALNSNLTGMLLMLDEPGRGLHEQDLSSLGNAIRRAAADHTVIMSEHRQRLVSQADCLIELGPGAGVLGGRVLAAGDGLNDVWKRVISLQKNRVPLGAQWLTVRGANINSVANADIEIPLGTLTCVAGISGSGKSSFVRGVLVPALCKALPRKKIDVEDFHLLAGHWTELAGAEGISALHALDQASVSVQPRSLVATYLDVASPIRERFAKIPSAMALDLAPSDFGTNSGRGRCQACLGLGKGRDSGPCAVCGGLRFGAEVLSIRLDGLNMAEVLSMSISMLADYAPSHIPAELSRRLVELGIGHLSLGRSLDTLSGGEVQRLRIARALSQHQQQRGAFFVIDEPACGLHPDDVDLLYRALRHIVAEGANTVVVVEHELSILARCDHLIEFGPGTGPEGGRVIAVGSPLKVSKRDTPTGHVLGKHRSNSRKTTRRLAGCRAPVSAEVATIARAEIRQLLGNDVTVPEEESCVRPAAIFAPRDDSRRSHELADLDQAIVGVALDALDRSADGRSTLVDRWRQNLDASLVINPFLDTVAVWGRQIPFSIAKEVESHARAMGLYRLNKGSSNGLAIRMTGERLRPKDGSVTALTRALADAAALGNGYIELVTNKGEILASTQDRLLDLGRGIVGPRRAAPAHFSRFSVTGGCRCCDGRGSVNSIDERFLIEEKHAGVFEEVLLEKRVLALLRGVRRSTMIPFFRRMVGEGLWPDVPWAKMSPVQRFTFLHGFWHRPGHGTFTKAGKDVDGSEANHWLLWDGLVPMLLAQLDRSKDEAWKGTITQAVKGVSCAHCLGSGLSPHASLLQIGGRSLSEWTINGTVAELLNALRSLPELPNRAQLARNRVLACLAPLMDLEIPLREIPSSIIRRKVLALAAEQFVGLPVIFL